MTDEDCAVVVERDDAYDPKRRERLVALLWEMVDSDATPDDDQAA